MSKRILIEYEPVILEITKNIISEKVLPSMSSTGFDNMSVYTNQYNLDIILKTLKPYLDRNDYRILFRLKRNGVDYIEF